MVIFHSYVSLPEGNQPNIQIWLRHNVSSWFVRTPSPQTIAVASLKLGVKKLLARKNTIPHLRNDFTWRQLKSN